MIGLRRRGICGADGAKTAALLPILPILAALAACSGSDLLGSTQPATPPPPPQSAPPEEPPPPQPPPVDLAGRWQLAAAAGGACTMNFADTPPAPGAVKGTIAPEGGCPGNFFTSRKWSFDSGLLVIRDFKNQPLAQLSYSGGQFQGQDTGGRVLTLSR